jgi:hypothetical protein
MRSLVVITTIVGFASILAWGCTADEDGAPLPREQLLDPNTCAKCHEDHFREWSGSMHAYAAEDPVFLAMNKRLQRETNGALGDFCVKCHAPMAVRDKKTKDGLDLASLPAPYRGVTCFFCHTVDKIGDLHNNGLGFSDESIMRGNFADPVKNTAHRAQHSPIHDGKVLDSASMCGSCHDIVTPGGAHIERTFAEWKASLFANETGQTCNSCHMRPDPVPRPIANAPGVFARTYHPHSFVGIDRALTPFPQAEQQKADIQAFLDTTLAASLCVTTGSNNVQLRVVIDNVASGHSAPSGAGADRRLFVELIAKKGEDVIYKSGVEETGKPIHEGPDDKDLWLIRDLVFDKDGKETHQFGQATCYETRLLPFPVTKDRSDPRYYQRNIARDFPADGSLIPKPDTITMRLRIKPVGLEVLDDLIASGDLDPAIRDRMETMQIGPTVTWKPGISTPFVETGTGTLYECVTETNQTYQANKFPPSVSNTCGR